MRFEDSSNVLRVQHDSLSFVQYDGWPGDDHAGDEVIQSIKRSIDKPAYLFEIHLVGREGLGRVHLQFAILQQLELFIVRRALVEVS